MPSRVNEGPTPLELHIVELIESKGPITFFEFMDLALYHPLHGFYSSPNRGPGIDYRTSTTLTPAFGKLVGRAFDRMRVALNTDFLNVIEVGGGTGQLASVVLESDKNIRWIFVERSNANVEVQRRAVWGGRGCTWVTDLAEADLVVGCVFANEVLDNFPIHLFEKSGRALEVFIDVGAGGAGHLVEVLNDPSSDQLRDQANSICAALDDGDRFELRPGAAIFAQQTFKALLRGYVLVVDYGEDEPLKLQRENPSGTLVTYRNGVLGADPLDSPGQVDITAHVDFSHLHDELQRAGFDQVLVLPQGDFLKALGIESLEESVEKQRRAAEGEGRHSDFVSLTAEKGRLHALRAEGSMGEFKVLIASKGAPPPEELLSG